MSPSDGYLWEYPGFPSLTTNYDGKSDLLFSGHVGVSLIAYLEFSSKKMTILANYCFITMLLQIGLVISLRKNLFIDILASLIFAHYIWLFSERYSHLIDVQIFNQPLKTRLPSFFFSCIKCQNPFDTYCDLEIEEKLMILM